MRKELLFFLLIFYLFSVNQLFAQQNVSVSDVNSTPDGSSVLDVSSTTKGLLIPRVALTATNAAAPITLPQTSLLVYNTATNGTAPINVSPGYYYNAGSPTVPNWVRLYAGPTNGGEWKLLGNSGTVANTNFLGTIDAIDLVFRTNNTEKVRIMSGGNVGIGIDNPVDKLHVAFGDVRVGELSTTLGVAGYGRRLFFSGGNSFSGNSDNTDPIFLARYNTGNDASELHLNLGDNNGYGGAAIDRFYIGNNQGGLWYPKAEFRSDGKVTFSRDGVGECCGNDATLALGENTTVTGRRPSISFHASGESEGTMNITQEATGIGTNGFTNRRIKFFDNQSQGLGIELTGNLWYGTNNSRTQSRDNASLQGNAGAQSGFFETYNPSNYPSTRGQAIGSWYHLLDVRHNNPGNNFTMQFSGSFFDQDIFVRKMDNNPAQPWARVQTSRDISFVKNEYTGVQSTKNAWIAVTGYSDWMDVNNGDKIKLDGMYYARLTGGSSDDFFLTQIEITGQNGCTATQLSNQHDYFHTTEAGADHDNYKPVVYMDVWNSNCNGQIRFRLLIRMNGDDNWEAREMIITGTRY